MTRVLLIAAIALICTACTESTRRSGSTQTAVQSSAQHEKRGPNRASAIRCAAGGYLGTAVSPPIGFGVFHIRNAWQGRRGRRFVNVYAGAFWKKPQRGMVALMEIPATNGPIIGASGWYAPRIKRDGALSITCVLRNTIYLTPRHFRYVFDLRRPGVRLLEGT